MKTVLGMKRLIKINQHLQKNKKQPYRYRYIHLIMCKYIHCLMYILKSRNRVTICSCYKLTTKIQCVPEKNG